MAIFSCPLLYTVFTMKTYQHVKEHERLGVDVGKKSCLEGKATRLDVWRSTCIQYEVNVPMQDTLKTPGNT